jgi:hypothetical protein
MAEARGASTCFRRADPGFKLVVAERRKHATRFVASSEQQMEIDQRGECLCWNSAPKIHDDSFSGQAFAPGWSDPKTDDYDRYEELRRDNLALITVFGSRRSRPARPG